MKNSKIISNGNQGFLCVDTQENLNQMCQWKVRLTYIHQNFPFALQGRVNPHFHSQQEFYDTEMVTPIWSTLKSSPKDSPADIHNEVLPLTLIFNPILTLGYKSGSNSIDNTHTTSQSGLKRNGRSVSEKTVEMAEIPFNPSSAK